MRLLISAIGKMKKGSPEHQLVSEYMRISKWKTEMIESEEKTKRSPEEIKQAESELLLKTIPQGAKIVVLDEKGKLLSSKELSHELVKWQDMGTQTVVFLIGGADGHTDTVRGKADLLLSLGKITLPHMLARVVLAEQLFRAKCIADNHPYHRE